MSKGRPAAELLSCLYSCQWPVRILVRTRVCGLLGGVLGGWERGRSELAGCCCCCRGGTERRLGRGQRGLLLCLAWGRKEPLWGCWVEELGLLREDGAAARGGAFAAGRRRNQRVKGERPVSVFDRGQGGHSHWLFVGGGEVSLCWRKGRSPPGSLGSGEWRAICSRLGEGKWGSFFWFFFRAPRNRTLVFSLQREGRPSLCWWPAEGNRVKARVRRWATPSVYLCGVSLVCFQSQSGGKVAARSLCSQGRWRWAWRLLEGDGFFSRFRFFSFCSPPKFSPPPSL